jgi:hypothetical protein
VSQLSVNTITNAAGGNTAQINGMTPTADSLQGFRNRIINGNMVIDQRNAGASVTPNQSYTLDRWLYENTQTGKVTIQQNAGSVTPPAGFTNYLGVTSTSDYSVLTGDTFLITHRIEGYNVADLAWGTANAQTITFSFWVRSSLTGTFGGSLGNVNASRSYPFSYTIASANTWEYKTVTVAGDTSGTWNTVNGRGLGITFGLGSGATFSGTAGAWASANLVQPTSTVSVVGTSGATFYITGVQLEAGSVATPFERIDYGRQLIQCQRYFETYSLFNTSLIGNSTFSAAAGAVLSWCVTKRAAPTVTLPSAGQSTGTVSFLTSGGGYPATTGTNSVSDTTVTKATINGSGYSGLTASSVSIFWSNEASTINISAEL